MPEVSSALPAARSIVPSPRYAAPRSFWPSSSRPTTSARRWAAFIDGAQQLALVLALAFVARALTSPAPFEYAESDTATWAWLMRHGEPIYGSLRDATLPMRLTHYPPLHLWLVAHLAGSDAAILMVARLLSLVGLWTTAWMAQLCTARATGSRRAGRRAARLVATTSALVYFGACGRGDLFALGLATAAMTALALRVRAWPLWSALLFALALLCKHNLVVLPLGALAWAGWRQPRQAALMALTLGALVFAVLWRGQLFAPLFGWTHTGWRLSGLLSIALSDALPAGAAVAVVVCLLRAWRRVPARAAAVLEPWLAAALVGCAWLLALARVGSAPNYLLEALLAVTILAAAAAQLGIGRRWYRLHVVVASAQTLVNVVPLLVVLLPRVEAELAAARASLGGVDGPVLAERTWLATAAGHPPVVIPFLTAQLSRRHVWNEAPLVELAQRRGLARALLDFSLDEPRLSETHLDRFSPALLAALRQNYALAGQVGDLRLYAPVPR